MTQGIWLHGLKRCVLPLDCLKQGNLYKCPYRITEVKILWVCPQKDSLGCAQQKEAKVTGCLSS